MWAVSATRKLSPSSSLNLVEILSRRLISFERHHISVFWSDEDECYVADVPDLGCSAFGDTQQEALEVLIAKELWLEVAREHEDTRAPIQASYPLAAL
jgi:predicted RNase H-like HicB family nuclease